MGHLANYENSKRIFTQGTELVRRGGTLVYLKRYTCVCLSHWCPAEVTHVSDLRALSVHLTSSFILRSEVMLPYFPPPHGLKPGLLQGNLYNELLLFISSPPQDQP